MLEKRGDGCFAPHKHHTYVVVATFRSVLRCGVESGMGVGVRCGVEYIECVRGMIQCSAKWRVTES